MSTPELSLRRAVPDDIPALRGLMDISIRALLTPYLTPAQLQASFSLMGLDTQLIADGTYVIVEWDGALVGCGGWGRRATLLGGDHSQGRSAALLDPSTDAARIRAMYTHPAYARRGIGRRLLAYCEDAVAKEGFARVELAATMAGVPLYRACGYAELEPRDMVSPDGIAVPMIIMGKTLPRI